MKDQSNLIPALEASKALELHRARIEDLDPDGDPIEVITSAFREERDLQDAVALAITGCLDDLAEEAEEVAADLYSTIVSLLGDADDALGALRSLALAVEEWSDLAKREARVDFGSDLVDAARDDLRRILVPLPVLELGDRRYGE